MAPKKTEPAAPPPPPPIPPAVIAAQATLDKWTARLADADKRISETATYLASQRTRRVALEGKLKTLATVASSLVPAPKQHGSPAAVAAAAAEAASAKQGAKPKNAKAAPAPAPPPPEPMASAAPPLTEEEELKRHNKLQAAVNAIFKRKRERPVALPEAGTPTEQQASIAALAASTVATPPVTDQQLLEEPGLTKPADLDSALWVQLLRHRHDRIVSEDALNANSASMEAAEARQANLAKLRSVAVYSLDAAVFELERAKEQPVCTSPPPVNQPSPPGGASSIRRPPSNMAVNNNRPPSQLLRR